MRADSIGANTGEVLVATVANHDATTTLFFGRLRDRVPLRFTELVPRSARHVLRSIRAEAHLADDVSRAAAVIVSRGLFEFRNLARAAGSLGIPCFYFVDDNLMVLREEGHADARFARGYTAANVRRALEHFDGVLCATDSLRRYFLENGLHDRVQLYPPVATAPALRGRIADGRLRLAFFGGGHRREPFVRVVFPAICQLAVDHDVTLFAAGLDGVRLDGPERLTIVRMPYDRDYDAALTAMAVNDIDILLHPSSETANNQYKNPHVLINARTLGAAPIFSAAPPYDAVAHEGVCLLADDTPEAWLAALNTLIDGDTRARMSARIADYCDRHFNGEVNVRCLNEIRGHADRGRRSPGALLALKLGSGLVVDMLRRAIPGRS